MQRFRVLIVDDEPMQRELISEILTGAGAQFDVLQAQNGAEALKLLRHESVDAVLLDKRMPDMDGYTVCRQIREELKLSLLPILMVTGSSTSDELTRSFAAGANDFIRKPYSPIELLARVQGAINTKRLTDQLDTAESLLFALARLVEAKDETTGSHCSRLSHMGVAFGRELGLDKDDVDALRQGGVLHDIGKLGIPDSILLKRGALTDEEWVIMRTHTVIGGHLCAGLTSIRAVTPLIVSHHERWDGTGYPHGLVGEDIPYLARIFQILDIYDALASERPYKKALPTAQIIDIFEQETARGWRDPKLVSTFLTLLQHDPEKLRLPPTDKQSTDERIFEAIVATGVIEWDRHQQSDVTL